MLYADPCRHPEHLRQVSWRSSHLTVVQSSQLILTEWRDDYERRMDIEGFITTNISQFCKLIDLHRVSGLRADSQSQ